MSSMNTDSVSTKLYVTSTATYAVNEKTAGEDVVARLDKLAALGALSESQLVEILKPSPQAAKLVGEAGWGVPLPEGKQYERPDFMNIESDMNVVQLMLMKTNQKIENDSGKRELSERGRIIENAKKELEMKKDAADKREAAALGNAGAEIFGGVVGLGGAAKAGSKLKDSFKAGGEQSAAHKSIELKQNKQEFADTKLRTQNDKLDKEINAEQFKARKADRKADEKQDEVDQAEANHRLYQAAPGGAPSPFGRAVAQKKQEQQAFRKEADGHRDEVESRRADKRDLEADHRVETVKNNRDIDRAHSEAKGYETKAQELNASGRNWTMAAQVAPTLINGIAHSSTAGVTQAAEYADAEASLISTDGQIISMRRESMKDGAEKLAAANASTMSTLLGIESARAEANRGAAASFKA